MFKITAPKAETANVKSPMPLAPVGRLLGDQLPEANVIQYNTFSFSEMFTQK